MVRRWVEDRYELTRKISEGTYGEVYVGRDTSTGETVALKRLKTLRGLDGFPITSLREVIALQHINHQRERLRQQQRDSKGDGDREEEERERREGRRRPADPLEEIIDLREVLLSKEPSHDIFLVFSYASSSMAGLLSRRFPFTLPDVAYIFRKIVLGVRKLHDMGIIHRDIKTDNVLICHDGAVQLADFGLCVFEGSGARALTPSMINLSYRPPEMLLGSTQYDTKVDVWSIGCFLAQVFLMHPPFYRRRSAEEQAAVARHNRSSETELEQLALIAEVLGPVTTAPADAFPASTCAHLGNLKKMHEAVLADNSNRYFTDHPGSSSSPHSQQQQQQSSSAAASGKISKMRPLFESSFLHTQYQGFRRWFLSQMENRRVQHTLAGAPARSHPLLLPSPQCVDVLCAIFQYDPRRRPTAAELLQTPFFQLHEGSGPRSSTATSTIVGGGAPAATAAAEAAALREREQQARARLAASLQSVPDAHMEPAKKKPPQP